MSTSTPHHLQMSSISGREHLCYRTAYLMQISSSVDYAYDIVHMYKDPLPPRLRTVVRII